MTDLLDCPGCKSTDLEEDYTPVTSTFTGTKEKPTGYHEYQSGWVNCNACQMSGPCVQAKDEEIDNISSMVKESWNALPRPSGLVSADAIDKLGEWLCRDMEKDMVKSTHPGMPIGTDSNGYSIIKDVSRRIKFYRNNCIPTPPGEE